MQNLLIIGPLFLNLPLFFWFPAVFVVGAVVGSFLNVCIYRMPLEKSPLWPLGSRCGNCLQPIRTIDNLPLLSYWLRRGRCRTCNTPFSIRYFLVELLTALGFVGLFYLVVVANVHDFNGLMLAPGLRDLAYLTAFVMHALLFCFLMVATFCDLDHRTIPLPLTLTGTALGLVAALLFPWPWPYTPAQVAPPQPVIRVGNIVIQQNINPWMFGVNGYPPQGVFAWPVWGPLPAWLSPGGNWQTGLATGLAGLLAGTLLLRYVRFIFGLGMGPAYMEDADPEAPPRGPLGRLWSWIGRVGGKTLGLGDADLMMMAGAFLGWQPTVAAFFIAVFPGILFGLAQLFYRGDNALPFGPALAVGAMIAALFWHRLGPPLQFVYFNGFLLLTIVVLASVLMLGVGYGLRIFRMMRPPEPEAKS